MKRLAPLLSASLLVAACQGNPLATLPDMARPAVGAPIDAPKGTWTWVDFDDSYCDNGTHTGIGIKITSSKNLIIFMTGGGACWDYLTCFQLGGIAKGPFGKPEFDATAGQIVGSVLDDTVAGNPFKDWNMVFVPYCTGDVHSGDNIMMYSGNGMPAVPYYHKGRSNVTAYLKRLGATFPALDKVVVSGSSAGGFGASFDYDLYRSYFPDAKGYLLDDSGPALEGSAIPTGFRAAWYTSWRLDKVLDGPCPGCRDDLSLALKLVSNNHPRDRLVLLSSTQDKVIRTYFLLAPTSFETELRTMLADILDPAPNFRYFVATGEFHTFLGAPSTHTSGGVNLNDWLTSFVSDDAGWKSVLP